MKRTAELQRNTQETRITARLDLDGRGDTDIRTGIGFLDHMLTLMGAHGFLDIELAAEGDIEVDYHHTVEDVGLVMGEMLNEALASRQGIRRFGHAVTPMDDALAAVTVDLSKRPYLVFNLPPAVPPAGTFDPRLAKEFCRALATRGGLNLHINVSYGEDPHHILEAVFKAMGRALSQAVARDERIEGVRSTKGTI
ncbi:MAG: imidazoleglycerol-phosphate dehydratase HisB [Desulfobacterales bacterium]|nr:imidazoleglycerol-phosphate dehydratase HisB [Desulfobacterales bacterium]MDJ0854899.1 imidazoleglycerol-phosphate dehydratase HisB [Desulfobacterales bacterium]MDJ0886635.1 imidazoleglycerol-phosphate dehydratase HisB [Desulfobacterales bacterium]MDJ0991300.1 imidazoleglycerol-phosphate dehydratase HisB [Desulfobacterales bacterium]